MMVTKEIQELQSGTFRAFDGLKLFPDTRLENRNRNEQHRHADNDEHDVHVDFANAAADADANRTHAMSDRAERRRRDFWTGTSQ